MSPDTPLRGLPVAVVDFETTGLPVDNPHVVSLAVVHATLGETDDARVALQSLVRPPVPIPGDASRVHGIFDADVADAPTWAEVAESFEAACAGRVAVAFNAPADFVFQRLEQERAGRVAVAWPWLDLLVVRKATKTRGRPGKLVEVAGEHGIVLDAHGAVGDALATALLLTPLMRAAWSAGAFKGPAGAQPRRSWHDDCDDGEEDEPARVDTIGAFFRWQREAALYQERDFVSYLLRVSGGTGRRPESAWHALEGVEPPAWPEQLRTVPCPTCGEATRRRVGKGGALETVGAGGELHACAARGA